MYKCRFCHADVTERMTRVVTETRPRTYSDGRHGWEIRTELPACKACAETHAVPLPAPRERLPRAALPT